MFKQNKIETRFHLKSKGTEVPLVAKRIVDRKWTPSTEERQLSSKPRSNSSLPEPFLSGQENTSKMEVVPPKAETGPPVEPLLMPKFRADLLELREPHGPDLNLPSKSLYCLGSQSFYLNKIVVYESKTRFYLVGSTRHTELYRIMKVDRQSRSLSLIDDGITYTLPEICDLLQMIDEGNKHLGGLKKVVVAYGIVGAFRLLEGFYLYFITKRVAVGTIGGHSIYSIGETAYVYVPNTPVRGNILNDETRYKTLFFGLDLTKDFYFSYTYDLTHTLQFNMCSHSTPTLASFNNMYIWNHHLLSPFVSQLSRDSPWILPIMQGFFQQARYSVLGKIISVVLISRRSRFYAGTRFLKRGISEAGHVANDVETEQIVATSDAPFATAASSSHITSFVHIRGSVPLYWSQDASVSSPKPPITVQRMDPFYQSTILHFRDLFRRYGTPTVILNLVKIEEKNPREIKLGSGFKDAIDFLNHTLPAEYQIVYKAIDFRGIHKNPNINLMEYMPVEAEGLIKLTGIFHVGPQSQSDGLGFASLCLQHGVIRTNCVDSLDRTNAAQFFLGRTALGYQLYALGMTQSPYIDFESDIVSLLINMYEAAGNAAAFQYAGSALVNTISSYKNNDLFSQSRDIIQTLKRYYSNSFTDWEKQHSINLFLGNFIPANENQHLWNLESDLKLHNRSTRLENILFSNMKWWESPIAEWTLSITPSPLNLDIVHQTYMAYYEEFYQPHKLTFFDSFFKHKFNQLFRIYRAKDTTSKNNFYFSKIRTGLKENDQQTSFGSKSSSKTTRKPQRNVNLKAHKFYHTYLSHDVSFFVASPRSSPQVEAFSRYLSTQSLISACVAPSPIPSTFSFVDRTTEYSSYLSTTSLEHLLSSQPQFPTFLENLP